MFWFFFFSFSFEIGSYYVAQAALKLKAILLHQPLECQDYRHGSPYWSKTVVHLIKELAFGFANLFLSGGGNVVLCSFLLILTLLLLFSSFYLDLLCCFLPNFLNLMFTICVIYYSCCQEMCLEIEILSLRLLASSYKF